MTGGPASLSANAWGGARTTSVILFGGRSLATAISFGLNLYLAKALGPTAYGTYAFAIGVLTFLGVFFDLGFFAAAARLIASSSHEEQRELVGASYALGLIFSAIFALLVFVSSQVVDHVFQVKAGHVLLAIAIWSPAMIAPYLFEQTLKASGKLVLLSIWTVASKVLFMLILLWIVARPGLSSQSAAVAQMAAGVVAAVIVLVADPGRLRSWRAKLREVQAEQHRFGRPLYVGKIAHLGSYHTDKLLLAYFATAKEVGWYMFAMGIAGFVSMFAQSVAASAFRGFSGKQPIADELRRWNTIGILIGSVAIVIVASTVMLFYLGPEYRLVPIVLIPAVVATGFQAAFQPYNSWLLANGMGLVLRKLLFIVGSVNVVANLLLIPPFGMYGAAVASVFGMAAYWYLARRAYLHAIITISPVSLGAVL